MNNQHKNQEGFYALLHQRVQELFTKKMSANLNYNDVLEVVRHTAEEFGYDYNDLSIFGTFDSYLSPKNTQAKISPHPQMKAFERKKVS
jgi:hypothetical protein